MKKTELLIHTTHYHPFLWNSETLTMLYRAGYTNQYVYVPEGLPAPQFPEDVNIRISSSQIDKKIAQDAKGIVRLGNFIWMLDDKLINDIATAIEELPLGAFIGIPAPNWRDSVFIATKNRNINMDMGIGYPHHLYQEEDMIALYGDSWVAPGGLLDFIIALQSGAHIQDSFGNRVRAGLLQISHATQTQEIVDALTELEEEWQDKSQSLLKFLKGVQIAPCF